uniref:Epsin 3 n=1 Tax=Callorhinchus milii TaxID=7868 RepID=V9KKE8_CALMI
MTTSAIRRQVKNLVHNYSEAEIKVREATSNDPWGPPSSLMSDIADLTFNVVAFSEIMGMVWKRLNDHGKNWRHVYKALTLLDYLIKTGSEKVSQQCRENIYTVQTLKDFQYIDRDGKDQGINVREKAKQLVSLLKDEERLRQDRAHALKTKERMSQAATGLGSHQHSHPSLASYTHPEDHRKSACASPISYQDSSSSSPRFDPDLEQARPTTSGEEELQLQLALAMSREEAERGLQEQRERSSLVDDDEDEDDTLRRALEESRRESEMSQGKNESSLMDLVDIFGAPVTGPEGHADPWGAELNGVSAPGHPWGDKHATSPTSGTSPDPWDSLGTEMPAPAVADSWMSADSQAASSQPWDPDPWAGPPDPSQSPLDPWASLPTPTSGSQPAGKLDLLSEVAPSSKQNGTSSPDIFDMTGMGNCLQDSAKTNGTRRTPELFLDPNAASLVNLDSLLSIPPQSVKSKNPFHVTGAASAPSAINPFQVSDRNKLTLNQMQISSGLGQDSLTQSGTVGLASGSMPFMSSPPMALNSSMPVSLTLPPTFSGLAQLGGMAPNMGTTVNMTSSLPQPLMPVTQPAHVPQASGQLNPFL